MTYFTPESSASMVSMELTSFSHAPGVGSGSSHLSAIPVSWMLLWSSPPFLGRPRLPVDLRRAAESEPFAAALRFDSDFRPNLAFLAGSGVSFLRLAEERRRLADLLDTGSPPMEDQYSLSIVFAPLEDVSISCVQYVQ